MQFIVVITDLDWVDIEYYQGFTRLILTNSLRMKWTTEALT